MAILVITDGVFNNYKKLDELPFVDAEDTTTIVFHDPRFGVTSPYRNPKDRNQLEHYFKDRFEKDVILVSFDDNVDDTTWASIKKIIVLKTETDKEIPFLSHALSKVQGVEPETIMSMRQNYYQNFKTMKNKPLCHIYNEMDFDDPLAKSVSDAKSKIKRMKAKAKSSKKTKKKPRAPLSKNYIPPTGESPFLTAL